MYIYIYTHISLSLYMYMYIYIYIYIHIYKTDSLLGHAGRPTSCLPRVVAASDRHFGSAGMWCLRMWCLMIIVL